MMVQINIWLSPRKNSFRHKGKSYILNSQYCQCKKMIEYIRYIITVILVVLSYFCVEKGKVVYVAAGIMLTVYVFSLFAYIAKFPNDLEKLI